MNTENNIEMNIESVADSIGADLFGGEASATDEVELDVTLPEGAATETSTEETPDLEVDPAPSPEPEFRVPNTWRKEAQAQWDALPPLIKAEVIKREEDIARGITQYKPDAEFGRSINQILQPYMPILQQHGVTPQQQIATLMQAHHALVFGDPNTKANILQQIARDYGIPFGASDGEAPFVDPQVKSLTDTVKTLESKLSRYESAQVQTAREHAQSEINAFMSDPKNEYAQELTAEMAQLIESGQAKGLQDAYEKAVWLNAAVREKELTKRQQTAQEKAREEAKQAAAAAKKAAAANVSTSVKDASTAAPVGTMDDTLQETLAAIRQRKS